MQRQSSLPLDIEAAIERALDRKLPAIVRDLVRDRDAIATAKLGHQLTDRFVSLQEAASAFGVHRTTLLRWEQRQLIPPRRKLPGQGTGWLMSEVATLLLQLDRIKLSNTQDRDHGGGHA